MKRLLFVGALILAVLFASAQTQQGYVRTLGRPEKAGEPLGEVTVKVRGQHNTVKSNSNGNFEMVLEGLHNGDAYALQQVRKNGYELNESDLIGRPLAFSDKVPLTIVMVSSTQLQADKQRIENNAYKTAEKNFKAQYNLLEQQLNDNQLSIEQYRTAIQDLQDKFEKYQSLIDGLAEHYAHTDYDLLDEKDREINLCIENGELERADSLIRLLFDPISVLQRNKEALAKLDSQIGQANKLLAQANEDMAAVLKQQEKDAEYLYQLYTIALARYDQEKASQYIVTRALLDTTNVRWLSDAAYFLVTHNDYEAAAKFYTMALAEYQEMDEDQLANQGLDMACAMNNLGLIYINMNRAQDSEKILMESLKISHDQLESGNRQSYASLIISYTNLGKLYSASQRFSEAYEAILTGYNIYTSVATDSTVMSPSFTMAVVALIRENFQMLSSTYSISPEMVHQMMSSAPELLENIESFLQMHQTDQEILSFGPTILPLLKILADLYDNIQRYDRCENLLAISLEFSRKMAGMDPKAYMPQLIESLQNLALYYSDRKKYDESEALFEEAVALTEPLAETNPLLFAPALAELLCNMGDLCSAMGFANQDLNKLQKGEQLLNEALTTYRALAQREPKRYDQSLFGNLTLLGKLYQTLGNLTHNETYLQQSEQLLVESIEIGERLALIDAEIYEPHLATTYSYLGSVYAPLGILLQDTTYYMKSEKAYKAAIEIARRIAYDNPQAFEGGLASYIMTYGFLMKDWGKYDQCEPLFNEGLELWRRLATENPVLYELGFAESLVDIADYKTLCGQNRDAIKLAEEAYEISQRHKNDSPMLYLAATNILSNLYTDMGEYAKAHQLFIEMHALADAIHLKKNIPNEYVIILGNESFSYIFTKEFAKAEQDAREALEIDITQKWIFTNLAAALLFQGKYAEAEELYVYLKPELKSSLLDDLTAFERAGVIPKERKADVERIRKMLNE